MNDPNKAINVNLSSLLSLKAELLRKQQEVSKKKASRPEFVPTRIKSSSHSTNTKELDKSQNEEVKVYEVEDSSLLERSQRILQAKSKFYDRMTKTGGKLNSDDNCLVMFNRKQQEERDSPAVSKTNGNQSSENETDSSDDEHAEKSLEDAEDDWVEYTDCLGRSRKCLRKDLKEALKKDKDLADSMPERLDQSKANWMIDTKGSKVEEDDDSIIGPLPPGSVFNDDFSTISKLDEQKANWERKEQENLEKGEVHYQDVFFDEARQHGVGYYAFSTDEEERRRQQQELLHAREQTLKEQQQREELRQKRDKMIKDRVLAAKNRQRARQGLPPLEQLENNEPKEPNTIDAKAERKAAKKAEKLKRKQEEEEKQKEIERQQHVRPWDARKEDITKVAAPASTEDQEWAYRPDKQPLSQAEWNERQREIRNSGFAPIPEKEPPALNLKRKNFSNDISYNMMPPPNNSEFAPFQSSKSKRQFHKRSYESSNSNAESSSNSSKSEVGGGGVCIPPPNCLDYEYTVPAHMKKNKSSSELESSIEAGLRFLRNNSDKGLLGNKATWTAKADY